MSDTISQLRTYFTMTNAAFHCAMVAGAATGAEPIVSPMHRLHKLALEEIEKESPDLSKISDLIKEMKDFEIVPNPFEK